MKYVGKIYSPNDNSYCINLDTMKNAWIVPGCCCNKEQGATFKIVKEPYTTRIIDGIVDKIHTFVNVQSNATGNIYRVLFNKNNIEQLKQNIMKQSITLFTASLGAIDVVVKPNEGYRNTFEIGNKRVCFDNIVPADIDLRRISFILYIYDGVNISCELKYGKRFKNTVKFNLFYAYSKTEEVYPRKLA